MCHHHQAEYQGKLGGLFRFFCILNNKKLHCNHCNSCNLCEPLKQVALYLRQVAPGDTSCNVKYAALLCIAWTEGALASKILNNNLRIEEACPRIKEARPRIEKERENIAIDLARQIVSFGQGKIQVSSGRPSRFGKKNSNFVKVIISLRDPSHFGKGNIDLAARSIAFRQGKYTSRCAIHYDLTKKTGPFTAVLVSLGRPPRLGKTN
jgi:hypothetical protein